LSDNQDTFVIKKRRPKRSPLLLRGYDVGGKSSVKVAGFFRKVKNPAATGTRIIKKDRHRSTYPIVAEKVCGDVTPLLVTSNGVPVAISAPQMQLINARQPQMAALITVAMIPRVLFCIFVAP